MTVKCSVIISYYKNLDALELILSALRAQSAVGQFEVIVSEDDDSPSTVSFLHGFSSGSPYEIKHVSQEDKNFRKCMALNQSLKIAEGELIVFLDGDCIPHRRLVGQYLKNMAPKMVLVGRRVDLSKRLSEKILRSKKLKTQRHVSAWRSAHKRSNCSPCQFKGCASSMITGSYRQTMRSGPMIALRR